MSFFTTSRKDSALLMHFSFGGDFNKNMSDIFTAQEELYNAGARNFMFVDVPPMDRCPGSVGKSSDDVLLGRPSLNNNDSP